MEIPKGRVRAKQCPNSCPWWPDTYPGDVVVRMCTVMTALRSYCNESPPCFEPFCFLTLKVVLRYQRPFLIQSQKAQTTSVFASVGAIWCPSLIK